MSFWRQPPSPPFDERPSNSQTVRELVLNKHFSFQYENFLVSTQHELFLLLSKEGTTVDLLRFDGVSISRYGSPNDETRGGHPLAPHGLGLYGLFEVENSAWIHELMVRNRIHPNHKDSLFANRRHFVACFKDVMLEVVCRSYEQTQMQVNDVLTLINRELENLGGA